MAIRSTPLSTVLNRMDRYTSIIVVPEAHKVRDLDEAIRTFRREQPLPWTLKQGSLKVFDDVDTYPVASDHDEIAYLDKANQTYYAQTARFRYTSLRQFKEDPDNRNQMAEIFDSNQRYLGVNYKDKTLSSILLNNAETVGDWTVSDDASSVAADTVTYKEGNGSMRVAITNSAGIATISNDLTSALNDLLYNKKYHFKWIYLPSTLTSLEMRLQTDASNYLTTTVTTQFSGQPFKANGWNLVAHNLDEATEVGTFNSASIASEKIILTDAPTGTYYVDASYLRQWELMDYWYYSIFSIKTLSASVADQEYFYNSSDVYSTDSEIIGDSEWVDFAMYDAMVTEMTDMKDMNQLAKVEKKRDTAWKNLLNKYP